MCVSVFTVVALKPPLAKHHIEKKPTEEFIIQQYKQSSLKKYYKSFFTGVENVLLKYMVRFILFFTQNFYVQNKETLRSWKQPSVAATQRKPQKKNQGGRGSSAAEILQELNSWKIKLAREEENWWKEINSWSRIRVMKTLRPSLTPSQLPEVKLWSKVTMSQDDQLIKIMRFTESVIR